MHATLTRAATGDQPAENATIVGEEMYGWLCDIEGFKGFVLLSEEGTTVGITFWENAEIAERHRAARREFLGRMLSVADAQVEEIVEYDVTFAAFPSL